MIIRNLRLKSGWSQEQLAEMSGVSTRTIQRIERGGKASLESLKCLAAVFENNITDLQEEPKMTHEALTENDRLALKKVHEWMGHDDFSTVIDPDLSDEERDAIEYVRDLKWFYHDLFAYLAVMAGLLVINLLTGPGYLWVIWPALGWGTGLFFHALSVFDTFNFFNKDWEQRQIAKRLGRK